MRRQDIQLIASARQGDIAARCEAGRRYLLGVDGFARHVATGIDYLTHPALKDSPQAARIIAESLPLDELLALQQERALALAAGAGSVAAQVKLGAWESVQDVAAATNNRWLQAAAASGHAAARRALMTLRDEPGPQEAVLQLLRSLSASADLDGHAVALAAADRAHAAGDLSRFSTCLRIALALSKGMTGELNQRVAAAVSLAEGSGQDLRGIDAEQIRSSLEARATAGDRDAAYAFGRGLCGIECAGLEAAVFAEHLNMRKGAAFLLRAADAGCDGAWMHLYRLHSDQRLSVANAQLARFFLEKAAARGQTEAQRKLGALLLREANSLAESEQAIQWVHQAASEDDPYAKALLDSLVLHVPTEGRAEDATLAIEQVRRADPWLAARLELAREFGLTKLEALCVDPVEGLRPWGLVVGKNPFISQSRLSAPRAIPALTAAAHAAARRAASFFGQSRRDAAAAEGDLRRRSLRQRRLFERFGLSDSMFFVNATSMTLESLRSGAKWAFRARQPLNQALAA